ncbi:hypothetical protein [Sporisorium scitamineum]|uniref:Glycosyltransferase 2-like domain-containing protein n=1 Tax=Sporisorium scitamineum TaxID=49012 RepID=A0A0F7S2S0_9BASI|nr:hypothetical protein [Sporisorium scitamineum]
MTQCPEVGVLQHCSGVMIVSDSYFELGIAFFTRLVNFSISFTVAAGDVAPFMGHNAFLRWSAMQEASFVDPEDGIRKIWSESHVSEDFDMAFAAAYVRLHHKMGYVLQQRVRRGCLSHLR